MTAKEFLMGLPTKVDPAALEGEETRFHFEIEGEGDVTLAIEDGKLLADEGKSGEPSCVVKANGKNFLKLVQGDLNPMMAILTGKVKISNQKEMIKYAKLFGLM